MKAIITVTGIDGVGIVAKVSSVCAEYGVSINDISQSVIGEYFAMIMVASIDNITVPFGQFVDIMTETGNKSGLVINTMHEDIFNSMHRI